VPDRRFKLVKLVNILVAKEFKLELRRKSVIAGIGLYLFSLVFVCYLTFRMRQSPINAVT